MAPRGGTSGRPGAILYLLHASPFLDQIGGTEHHVLDLLRGLALERAAIAYPAGGALAVAEVREGRVDRPRFRAFPWPPAPALDVPLEPAARALVDAARLLGARAVHVQHLLGFPAGLGPALAAAGLPYAVTVHDYFAACPNFHRFDFAARAPCACDAAPDAARRACLAAFARTTGLALPRDPLALAARHRAAATRTLSGAEAVIFPSGSARASVLGAVPVDPARTIVLEHGHDGRATARRAPPGPLLRVAVAGRVSNPLKGPERYAALVAATRGEAIEWHFFGTAPGDPAAAALGGGRAVLHGPYRRDALPDLLAGAGIDLCAVFPAAEETFSYVLSEALVAGIPALVSDRGALAERVRRERVGFVAADVPEAAALLAAIARDRRILAAPTARARAYRHPTATENAARHRALYAGLGWLPLAPAAPLDAAGRAALAASSRPGDPAAAAPTAGRATRIARALRPVLPGAVWNAGRGLVRRLVAVPPAGRA